MKYIKPTVTFGQILHLPHLWHHPSVLSLVSNKTLHFETWNMLSTPFYSYRLPTYLSTIVSSQVSFQVLWSYNKCILEWMIVVSKTDLHVMLSPGTTPWNYFIRTAFRSLIIKFTHLLCNTTLNVITEPVWCTLNAWMKTIMEYPHFEFLVYLK